MNGDFFATHFLQMLLLAWWMSVCASMNWTVILAKLLYLLLFNCNSNISSGKITHRRVQFVLTVSFVLRSNDEEEKNWMMGTRTKHHNYNNKINKVRVGRTHIVYTLILLRSNNIYLLLWKKNNTICYIFFCLSFFHSSYGLTV